jgi:hypothetical protein
MIRLVLFLLLTTTCLGQELLLLGNSQLAADTFIGLDGYDYTYSITDNIISKSGVKGTFQFSDIQLGDVTTVDIINPLKVVAFYNAFNTVVFLDNRLNEIKRINFNDLPNFLNAGAARNAGNNRLWLLNTDTQQIELYNYGTQQRIEISQPITAEIKELASNFNYCFVLTDQEVRQYNIYGGLLHVYKISEGRSLTQDNENLVVRTASQLLYKSNSSENLTPLIYREILPISLQLQRDLLYIYNGEKITIFSLNQPKK